MPAAVPMQQPVQSPPEIPGETPENALDQAVTLYRYKGGEGLERVVVTTEDKLDEALINGYRQQPPPEVAMELFDWQVADNLADLLFDKEGKPKKGVNPDMTLGWIAQRVIQDYEVDDASREDWLKKAKKATKLATLQKDPKTTPWPNAANVVHPLVALACLQHGSRAYGEVIKGNEVVKAKAVGDDSNGVKAKRAKRVGHHMSWQLLEETKGWEEGMDKLVNVYCNVGKGFKKIYWCNQEQKLEDKFIKAENLVVHNDATSLDEARRITHTYKRFANEALEDMRAGLWSMVDLGVPPGSAVGEDAPHDFIEQACWFDLDGDGYQEPYYVTVHPETQQVVCIQARWEPEGIVYDEEWYKHPDEDPIIKIVPELCYVDYTFLPSPDGSFYGMGYGTLLGDNNEIVDSIINQLLDAGTLANAGGGWITEKAGLPSGEVKVAPGRWNKIRGMASGNDIRQNMIPYPVAQPSPVLFQLLEFIILGAKEMASIGQLMTGMGQAQNVNPTVIMAMLEQGLKVYNTIHKRLYRSLQTEFRMIYRLNSRYLNPELYQRVLDSEDALQAEDYKTTDLDIYPVADPSISSETIRMAKAQAMMPFINDPGCNGQEIKRFYFDAIGIDGVDRYVKTVDQVQQEKGPMAALQIKMLEVQMQAAVAEIGLKQANVAKALADMRKIAAEITNIDAKSMEAIANVLATAVKEGDKIIEVPKVAEVFKALEYKEKQEEVAGDQGNGDNQRAMPRPAEAQMGNAGQAGMAQ